jgi:hypothetical protein
MVQAYEVVSEVKVVYLAPAGVTRTPHPDGMLRHAFLERVPLDADGLDARQLSGFGFDEEHTGIGLAWVRDAAQAQALSELGDINVATEEHVVFERAEPAVEIVAYVYRVPRSTRAEFQARYAALGDRLRDWGGSAGLMCRYAQSHVLGDGDGPDAVGELGFASAEDLTLVEHLNGSLERRGVDVRVASDASVAGLQSLAPDVVVVVTGASWETTGFSMLRPDREGIPGAERGHVISAVEAIAAPERCGRRVVIVDDHGTHLALGLAQLLARDGRAVEFVTAHPQPGIQTGVLGTVDFPWVYPRLVQAGVRFSVEATVAEIEPRAVQLAHLYGGWTRSRTSTRSSCAWADGRRMRSTAHSRVSLSRWSGSATASPRARSTTRSSRAHTAR